MKSLLKIAEILDKLGKYSQSDKIVKIAQYSQFAPESSTTGKSNFGGDVTSKFDATAIGKKTQGLQPELSSGPGRDEIYTFRLPNFQEKQELFKTAEGMQYYDNLMVGFGENLAQMSQGLGVNSVINMTRSIVGALQGTPAEKQSSYYKNIFDPVLTDELTRVLQTEPPTYSIQAFQFVYQNINLPEVQETFRNSVTMGIQNLYMASYQNKDQRATQQYTAVMAVPFYAQYNIQQAS